MSKVIWVIAVLFAAMLAALLLMPDEGRDDCDVKNKKVGNRVVKVVDCE